MVSRSAICIGDNAYGHAYNKNHHKRKIQKQAPFFHQVILFLNDVDVGFPAPYVFIKYPESENKIGAIKQNDKKDKDFF